MSVHRPMAILQRSADVVAAMAQRGALTPAEIAEDIDMPRPSVYRLGDALREVGMVETASDSHLKLSLRWLRLADAARAGMSEWAHARDILDGLAGATRQTAFLSVPRGHEAICIDWARGEAINVLILKPGRSLPLYAGAAGRITLAFGLEDPDPYLGAVPFQAFTARTLTTASQLIKDVKLSKKQGFVISDGDVTDGIGALGAPIVGKLGHGFAGALSIAGPAEQLNGSRSELLTELLTSAEALSRSLPSIRQP